MPCPAICAQRRPRQSAMPALMMPSGSAVTRYRMSGEPSRALRDTGTASVRNARQLSRAAVRMTAPRAAVRVSVPRIAPHMSVSRTAAPKKMSRTAAHKSAATVPTRATTATIAVTITAASTSGPSFEALQRDAVAVPTLPRERGGPHGKPGTVPSAVPANLGLAFRTGQRRQPPGLISYQRQECDR
jgi:hypothetical protein